MTPGRLIVGEVVSIRRSKDDDLLAQFEERCPDVPVELSASVHAAAEQALGYGKAGGYEPSFKTVCVTVALASFVGLLAGRGLTSRWNQAVDATASINSSTLIEADAESRNNEPEMAAAFPVQQSNQDSWRRSKVAWAEYITRLEKDPFYQHVIEEKRRFEMQFPSE